MNKRLCVYCKSIIADTRKSSARYCSFTCYYTAKKQKSKARYKDVSEHYNLIMGTEALLEKFYVFTETRTPLTFQQLDKAGFNWGVVSGEFEKGGRIWKIVGRFAYCIDPLTKNIEIWKIS